MKSEKRMAPSSRQAGIYKRLLVPLDGSRRSESALPHAIMLAAALQSEIVLFRVVEQVRISPDAAGHEGPGVARRMYEQAVKSEGIKLAAARRYLERHAKSVTAKGVSISVAAAIGKPSDQILEYCRANLVDLVVMTTRGRGRFKRLFLGSVAEAIVRSPIVPVLVITSPTS